MLRIWAIWPESQHLLRRRCGQGHGGGHSSALAHAEKTIRDHDTVVFERQDAEAFLDAIVNLPAPNDRLRGALEEHSRRVDSG